MAKLLLRLQDASRSGAYRATQADPILEAARGSALDVARITLDGVGDKAALLARIAEALGFPRWFGGNWDALEDCLGDLSWRPAPGHVLLFEASEPLRARSGDDFGVLLDILGSSARFWAERGKPFFAVFVDPARRLALPDLYAEKAR